MAAFDLPVSRLADAQALVSRFTNKAAKLGMAAPTLTVTREFPRVWVTNSKGDVKAGPFDGGLPCVYLGDKVHTAVVDMVTVEVTGERPIVAGWRFAAVIESTEAGNILRKSPDFDGDLPERFRQCTSECDHCRVIRQRNETFVVHNDKGEFKQVGRTCLQDFTGAADPSAWLAKYAFERALADLADCYGEDGGYGHAQTAVMTSAFLAMVAASVREFGYVSSAKARDSFPPVTATGRDVFHGATDKDAAVRKAYQDAVTDADRALAQAAVAWLASDDVGEVSDYIHNLRVYTANETVNYKGANTLASLIQTYRRFIGAQSEKAAKVNEHLPGAVVKKRLRDLSLTLVAQFSFDTMYGTKWIMKFEDREGRCVVWKTTSPGHGYGIGDTVSVTGTVKELGDYKGTLQTELSRCKIVVPDAESAAA